MRLDPITANSASSGFVKDHHLLPGDDLDVGFALTFWRRGPRLGLSLIAAGHYATEFPVTAAVAEKLRAVFPEVEVLVSTENRDPYTYL